MDLNLIFTKLIESFEYTPQAFSQIFELGCRLGRLNDVKVCIYKYKSAIMQNSTDLYPILAKICIHIWEQTPIPKLPELEKLAKNKTEQSNVRYILALTVSQTELKRNLLKEAYTLDKHNLSVVRELMALGEKVSIESLRQLYRVDGLKTIYQRKDKHFKFVALGGGNEVGASAYYLEIGEFKILVDYGLKFDKDEVITPDISALEALCDIKTLDAILLTHAHLDHCGGLLELYKAYPSINIIMTPQTKKLLKQNMLGMVKDEVDHYHLTEMLQSVAVLPFNKPLQLNNKQLCIEFYKAGHILGAASILITTEKTNVFITGDFCLDRQGTVGAMQPPQNLPIDVLITESTYCNRQLSNYKTREMLVEDLNFNVKQAILEGKSVLIPAFALGRSQEILMALKQLSEEMKFRIYIDGLATEITDLYSAMLGEDVLNGPWIHPLRHQFYKSKSDFIKNEFMQTPCCVITSSGMLNEGSSSSEYAKYVLPSENALCILTGYQAFDTLGSRLKNQMKINGARYVSICGETYPVHCDVKEHSLSAHPSIADIMALTTYLEPTSVILVHGEAQENEKTLLHQALIQLKGCTIYQSYNNKIITL